MSLIIVPFQGFSKTNQKITTREFILIYTINEQKYMKGNNL